MKTKINKFLKAINTSKVIKVIESEKIWAGSRFEVKIREDKYINDGIINVSKTFITNVNALIRKCFNTEVHWNNTCSIFWFYKKDWF